MFETVYLSPYLRIQSFHNKNLKIYSEVSKAIHKSKRIQKQTERPARSGTCVLLPLAGRAAAHLLDRLAPALGKVLVEEKQRGQQAGREQHEG